MDDKGVNKNQICVTGLHICQNQPCSCKRSERTEQFLQLLNRLTAASKATDYEEQISATVAAICADEKLVPPLQLFLPIEFDERKHAIDTMAQQYLKQASKSVQHLIPLRSLANGNCLFNSIVSLVPESGVSAVELRVRTIIELLKNKTYYDNLCSNLVPSFNEAIRRTCNNNSFSGFYEVVALASVLQCEVQSVYPYIDYRAEMKSMNAVYKPVEPSNLNNARVVIFWTNCEDEISTNTRPGGSGLWSPNHFVPLLQANRGHRTTSTERTSVTPETPRKATIKNNRASSVRSPEFSPPPFARKHKTSATTQFAFNHELQSNLRNYDAERKSQERAAESEQQRIARLASDRLSKRQERAAESEQQRIARLASDRLSKCQERAAESEQQRIARLANDRLHKRNVKERDSKNQQKQSTTNRLSKSIENKHRILLDQYIWPAPIPKELKEYCLQDFCNHMSMPTLRQSTCIICNIRASVNTMKECALQDIPNWEKLACHTDVVDIIHKTQQATQDENAKPTFFFVSNAVLYKKGYNTAAKTGNICQQCYGALAKDKVPLFSAANKIWIGDVPPILQQLTIAEEKLISLYRHNNCIIKLHSPFHHHSTAQAALKGNMITFMHNMPNIVTSLPLDVGDLCDTLKIVFVGARTPNRIELRKICGVSRQKVRNALLWLKSHHYMYRTIPIDEVNIAKLPEDDVPESIWATIERIENTADGDAERTGFVVDPLANAVAQDEPNITNVFPMNTSAVLDVNGTTISSEDISVHLLHKVNKDSTKSSIDTFDQSTENDDNVYMIPRSHMPVKDYCNPELLLGLFPTLFPYGCGAPCDPSRPNSVTLNQHIRYLLTYDDQRFEKHHSFMFIVFNMMQRQQACWNASLMASRPYFQDAATDLQALTSKEVEAALINVTNKSFSTVGNPRINMLMRQIKTVGGNVMGSAYSRATLRTKIHALIFNQGLPSIFMTINPADIHSRVALYFAGVDLDLDKILPETIPSTYERAQIIAAHPVATAHFFNQLISSILKCMVEKGLLGPIKAYFGTVENQGRGSLHLHILIWLDHDLTPSQLKESVQNEEFRNGLLNYLEDIIKQDLSNFDYNISGTNEGDHYANPVSNDELIEAGAESPEQAENNSTKLTPSIMPTPIPSMPNFALKFKKDVVELVNSSNVHNHTTTCYKYSKKQDNPTCRMRMPRRIENVSSINIDSGEIKLKRLHETINNFNEYIISACRSNMDIKYIFSGSDAKALVYYITDYVTKSSLSFHDTFSLVLKAFQCVEKQNAQNTAAISAEEKSRRLVLRCYNTLASQQELSGVQVASYLMGWPDHYTTHDFANLFLIGIENYLQATLIEAQVRQQRQIESTIDLENEDSCMETEEQFLLQPAETNAKYVFVNTRIDYQCRSTSLDNICLYDYIRCYRKKPMDTKDRTQLEAKSAAESIEPKDVRRGRPLSERETFQAGHPQASSHINIKRIEPVVPVLLGPPVPRRDREDTRERYCRSILTLFLPWRSIQDLCDLDQTWEQAFEARHIQISPESCKIIDNIQLLQECKNDRDEHLQQVIEAAQTESVNDHWYPSRNDSDSDDENNEILDVLENIDMSEIPALREIGTKAEEIYFEKTVKAVVQANRFVNIQDSRMGLTKHPMYSTKLNKQINFDKKHLVPATSELIHLNNKWQRMIKDEKERRRNACMVEPLENEFTEQNDTDVNELVGAIEDSMPSTFNSDDRLLNCRCTIPVTKVTVPNETTREHIAQHFTLNKNQKAAFMIITGHLDGLDRLNENEKQDQLIMCVPGCGGTGKSQLIRAITAYFTQTNRAHKLRKLAPTSVAAAEIEGMTIHSFLGDRRRRKTESKVMNRPGQMTLENVWRFVEYIILDEMSMVGLSLLARLSKLVATAKHCDPMTTMGGINIILFGDYIQYSPVFDKPLYHNFPTTIINNGKSNTKLPTENEIQQKSARALILQINCVVVLEQQMRTKDLVYQALLNRVRNGEGTHEDWLLLRTRVIGKGLHISLNDPPWNEAPILVYRNELRTELNNRAVINKTYEIGHSPTVVIATDTIKAKKHIDLPDLTKRLLALPDNKTEHLPGYLPLVPGMPVLLQENIACELGLSNGTPGIFRELVYDNTSEHTTGSEEKIFTADTMFVRNAQYALIEIPKSKMRKLNSLDPFIIPIPVIEKTFEVNLEKLYADKGPMMKVLNNKKLKTTITVKRKALPLVPAYSITTHKSQGQTLPKIVIDLNMPPGMVEVASAYVPLSRVQKLTDLIILQDFSINVLQVKPSNGQIAEINRLAAIFKETKYRYAHYFV